MVSNDLIQYSKSDGILASKVLPLSPDSPSVKKDLTKSSNLVWIGPKCFCEPVTSDADKFMISYTFL